MVCIDLYKGSTNMEEIKFFTTRSFIARCFLIGFCNALNGLFLVFAAPPSRTPTFLQAILGTFNMLSPGLSYIHLHHSFISISILFNVQIIRAWTILFRALILRKFPSKMQFLWAGGVFVGLFLASCPSIFGLNSGSSFVSEAPGAWKVMWPIIFASSLAPAAIMNVVGEDVLKETSESSINRDKLVSINQENLDLEEKTVNVWYYLTLQSVAQFLTFVCCFWVCIIPNFGTVNTVHDIFAALKQDWRYFFAMDGASAECPVRALVFIGCYIC